MPSSHKVAIYDNVRMLGLPLKKRKKFARICLKNLSVLRTNCECCSSIGFLMELALYTVLAYHKLAIDANVRRNTCLGTSIDKICI